MRQLTLMAVVAVLFAPRSARGSEVATLHAADPAEYDSFGNSVALERDILVVGSPFDDDLGSASGSAYVFERSPGGWVRRAKLVASESLLP